MNVAYICADPGIPVFGNKGASIHIQEVLRALLKKNAHITLIAQRLGGAVPEEFQRIRVLTLPALPSTADAEARAYAALKANTQIVALLKKTAPFDLVYERYSLWSHGGISYAHEANCKSVLEVNAPLIEEQRTWRVLPCEKEAQEVLQRLLQQAATIVAVSPGVKRWLDDFAPFCASRTHVVANGVNPQRFSEAVRQPNHLPVIGFLGTLKPWHGLQTLIDAFALLHQRGRRVQLSVVGDGPEYPAIQQRLTQFGLLDYARFSGAVSPAAVPALLAAMDIGVAPYPQLEGFYFSPLKIYEYMAAGLPVITTRTGHLAEIVSEGQTGLLVDPDNPVALCAALERLLDDRALCLRLGAAAKRQATEEHSWDRVVTRILQLAELT
ncbi:glycosyltransferase family 4 protein [Mixta intestinalis]|jgi:glycosyltransferase involved in cell wall biosynthesis|uniref:D-inositol 3-phosphate glycosyltransferase n=1 Tax=Mixta intestinalis TaxID=1615494 RepID=A0A6P1Q2B7_9GAMM|nr:glycosyltransferase family 4 protein [Mixta intestinalis]QHM71995.1 D-inositol 3-phosphate glycosyltransferase [Mixta intestinalis]